MSEIGLFFGPEQGSVHRIAEKIKKIIGSGRVDLIPVGRASAADLEKYDKIIFGISTVGKETWEQDFSNTDWSRFFPEISKVSFSQKIVAIFGLGDHITYPAHFVNAMGVLAKEIRRSSSDARIVGKTETTGYDFEDSEAVADGKFIGLPIDEDFEPELTDQRIADWIDAIRTDFGF